jgi:hypothetical protein
MLFPLDTFKPTKVSAFESRATAPERLGVHTPEKSFAMVDPAYTFVRELLATTIMLRADL